MTRILDPYIWSDPKYFAGSGSLQITDLDPDKDKKIIKYLNMNIIFVDLNNLASDQKNEKVLNCITKRF